MAPDPYGCDAVFSASLLTAFCAAVLAVLTVGMVDWVVTKSEQPSFSKEAETANFSRRISLLPETRTAQNLSGPTAKTDDGQKSLNASSRNNQSKKVKKDTLVAQFKWICVINDVKRHCQPLNTFSNTSLALFACAENNETLQAGGNNSNIFRLSRAMLENPVFLGDFHIIAVSLVATAAVVINLMAVFNKQSQIANVTLGTMLLVAGAAQIACVAILYQRVILHCKKPVVRLGMAGYFSAGSGCLCPVTSLLLFISLCKKRRQQSDPVLESKIDIPFQNHPGNLEEESPIRYPSSKEFFTRDADVMSELEWGYSPTVVDHKEVRFEFDEPVKKRNNDVNPEILMCNDDIKITEIQGAENVPSTSDSQMKMHVVFSEQERCLLGVSDKNGYIAPASIYPNLDAETSGNFSGKSTSKDDKTTQFKDLVVNKVDDKSDCNIIPKTAIRGTLEGKINGSLAGSDDVATCTFKHKPSQTQKDKRDIGGSEPLPPVKVEEGITELPNGVRDSTVQERLTASERITDSEQIKQNEIDATCHSFKVEIPLIDSLVSSPATETPLHEDIINMIVQTVSSVETKTLALDREITSNDSQATYLEAEIPACDLEVFSINSPTTDFEIETLLFTHDPEVASQQSQGFSIGDQEKANDFEWPENDGNSIFKVDSHRTLNSEVIGLTEVRSTESTTTNNKDNPYHDDRDGFVGGEEPPSEFPLYKKSLEDSSEITSPENAASQSDSMR